VANPPGHMSRAGLQATGANLVAPGGWVGVGLASTDVVEIWTVTRCGAAV
jgi:hypothetical protein